MTLSDAGGDAHTRGVEVLGHRRAQLAHRDRDRVDPRVGQHDLGDAFRQALEQREPLGRDHPLDIGRDGAVVDGVVELVGGAGGRQVGVDVEIDLEAAGRAAAPRAGAPQIADARSPRTWIASEVGDIGACRQLGRLKRPSATDDQLATDRAELALGDLLDDRDRLRGPMSTRPSHSR